MADNQRSWNCPQCNEELGELNAVCEYCKAKDGTIVYNPDKYFVRDIRIPYICEPEASKVTPQEELFATLFNHEKLLVKDMELLELRAHREELAKIAFEARARLTAVDDEEKTRKKKTDKPTGFERSLNIDETSSDAINTIKERQKRMSKEDKIKASLIKLYQDSGMTLADAQKEAANRMTAGTILANVKDKESKEAITSPKIHSPLSQENGFVMPQRTESETPKTKIESKPLFNPFEKKG